MYPEIPYSSAQRGKLLDPESTSPDNTDCEFLLPPEKHTKHRRPNRLKKLIPWLAHGSSIMTCLMLLLYTLYIRSKMPKNCLAKFSSYSPVLEAVDEDDFQETKFQYSLWYQSPFKGPPTPEVEDAWQSIMRYGEFSVPASEILRIGHNLTAVRFPPSLPTHADEYPVFTSGTHAIHCLHYLWQDHHISLLPIVSQLRNDIPEMYERHYEHCVDYMRQYIMCKFDTTIIPFYWVRNHDTPTPNGNTVHKCVNWESVQGWLGERVVVRPEGFEWRQPEGAVVLDDNP